VAITAPSTSVGREATGSRSIELDLNYSDICAGRASDLCAPRYSTGQNCGFGLHPASLNLQIKSTNLGPAAPAQLEESRPTIGANEVGWAVIIRQAAPDLLDGPPRIGHLLWLLPTFSTLVDFYYNIGPRQLKNIIDFRKSSVRQPNVPTQSW
jgi:hypothetical protein